MATHMHTHRHPRSHTNKLDVIAFLRRAGQLCLDRKLYRVIFQRPTRNAYQHGGEGYHAPRGDSRSVSPKGKDGQGTFYRRALNVSCAYSKVIQLSGHRQPEAHGAEECFMT